MAKKRLKINQQITKVFEGLLDEYLHDYEETKFHVGSVDSNDEGVLIKDFLVSPCSCGKACKNSLGLEEIAKSRKKFSSLSWVEKNAFMFKYTTQMVCHYTSPYLAVVYLRECPLPQIQNVRKGEHGFL